MCRCVRVGVQVCEGGCAGTCVRVGVQEVFEGGCAGGV